jgi:hypothetical protein
MTRPGIDHMLFHIDEVMSWVFFRKEGDEERLLGGQHITQPLLPFAGPVR